MNEKTQAPEADQADELQDVPLDAIDLTGETQARVAIDGHIVNEYAEAMAAGAQFPPVVLFRDAKGFWVGDGHHRCRAAKQVGSTTIRAEVREGSARKAFLYACAANATHGLRRSALDTRHVVERLLMDKQWSQWSDRELARRCAVSHPYVGKLRAEIAARRARTSGNDYQMPETRTVHRGETTYAMDTSRIGTPTPVNGAAAVEAGPASPGGANGHPPTLAAGRGPDPLGKIQTDLRAVLGAFDSNGLVTDHLQAWSPEDWQRFDERLGTISELCQQLRTKSLGLRAGARDS